MDRKYGRRGEDERKGKREIQRGREEDWKVEIGRETERWRKGVSRAGGENKWERGITGDREEGEGRRQRRREGRGGEGKGHQFF